MRVIIIVSQKKFNNAEFIAVINTMKKNKILFEIASVSKSEAFGYSSFSIKPDISIQELNVSDYDCLIIIGGSGSKEYLWKNYILHEKIKTAFKSNKIIAAICLAPICLIYSDIIKNTYITAFKTAETMRIIKESDNIYKDIDVCSNGNIITANGPKATNEFCETIIKKLVK